MGYLRFCPKKNRDQTLIKNKRDICLLDIIYKIVSKAIANRLLSVIDHLQGVIMALDFRNDFNSVEHLFFMKF